VEWYYLVERERLGPVTEEELGNLAANGTITPQTLVWHEGIADWQPYETVQTQLQPATPAPAHVQEGVGACSQCGNEFSVDEMLVFDGAYVCAQCKPLYLQKLKEGVAPGMFVYGGFWTRFGAKFLDGVVLGITNNVLGIGIGALGMPALPTFGAVMLVQFAISAAYTVYFLTNHGATPGKMACGLKVIRSDGSPLTPGRAFGRYGAEMLSGFTFGIGYIMAAFDDEKRTLHDRICDTRVVKK